MGAIYSEMGVPLALDDIGANRSMVDLNLLPKVNYLKLSLDWINRISEQDALTLLETIIGYSLKADKKTILEGVETLDQFNLAKDLGVDFVQGYLYRHLFCEKFQHEGVSSIETAA